MNTPFNEAEVAHVMEKISTLVKTADESEVRAYINEQFSRMPKSMQDELTASMFITAMNDEARELDVISKIQEEGLAASAELEAMEEDVRKEGGSH